MDSENRQRCPRANCDILHPQDGKSTSKAPDKCFFQSLGGLFYRFFFQVRSYSKSPDVFVAILVYLALEAPKSKMLAEVDTGQTNDFL
jgi:hypothetical protein